MRSTGILWRDTARPVRFFILDARALICLGIWALYMCMPTFYLSIFSMVLFLVFERFGVTPAAAWRFMRHAPFSKHRERHSLYLQRRNSRW